MTAPERRVYLDYNAGGPLLPEARLALVDSLDATGNPSSVHAEGRRAHAIVERARASVAALVGAQTDSVVFTSGASEAAATCLTPCWIEGDREVRVSGLAVLATDHPCILEGGRFEAASVTRLGVDAGGQVLPDALRAWLAALGRGRGMLALTLGNSETGVIQPLPAILEAIHDRNVVLVIDAVQAAGRLPLDIARLGADALILSGHKIGAGKGVGAYVLKTERFRPAPLIIGGAQEKRRRAGTEPVPAIAGFGAAAAVAASRAREGPGHLEALHDRLESGLRALQADAVILGSDVPRLPNTVAFAIPGLTAETAAIALDLSGFAVSSGSACSSGKVGPSHVLQAMAAAGLAVDAAAGAIRASFGAETTTADIDGLLAALARLVGRRRTIDAGRKAA